MKFEMVPLDKRVRSAGLKRIAARVTEKYNRRNGISRGAIARFGAPRPLSRAVLPRVRVRAR